MSYDKEHERGKVFSENININLKNILHIINVTFLHKNIFAGLKNIISKENFRPHESKEFLYIRIYL